MSFRSSLEETGGFRINSKWSTIFKCLSWISGVVFTSDVLNQIGKTILVDFKLLFYFKSISRCLTRATTHRLFIKRKIFFKTSKESLFYMFSSKLLLFFKMFLKRTLFRFYSIFVVKFCLKSAFWQICGVMSTWFLTKI